ncbi:MAG: hypothetical protein H0W88_06730 [Parachlamydiaceae bacterium]|nr:hypothetical protein [Parachlamydiaceae bacterium]
MDDVFKIFIEQLRDGHERIISEKLSPEFLDVHEKELTFEKDVEVEGVAYLAEDELIINWSIHAEPMLPCSICNEKVPVDINLHNLYHSEPVANIKTGVFHFKDLLRETILLEVPPFAECNQGNCPKREEVKKYMKERSTNEPDEEEGYRPFADLDWK